MKLSQMRHVLQERGWLLTRSLGQNFLHDANQLRRIVELADLKPGEKVLEIGPGLGPLTEQLLAKGCHVLAVEKDLRLVTFLQERFSGENNLSIRHGDALEILKKEPADWREWKMVSNLPYSVGSPILVELAKAAHPPRSMVATLQWEVVRRLMAAPGHSDYGLLTLLVQAQFYPADFFKIPAGCFFPEPDVESACLVLHRRDPSMLESVEFPLFERVVKRSFSQRRKMMIKLLKQDWPEAALKNSFLELGISLQARAETLHLEQFIELARRLKGGAHE